MSWPADGKPRYVTSHIEGPGIAPGAGHGDNHPHHYVHDRANCFRVVALFAGNYGTGARRAAERAKVLNDLEVALR